MGRALRPVIAGLIAAAFMVPLLAGLLGTLLSAAGVFPGSLPGMSVFDDPRWIAATHRTLISGLGASALALALALLALAAWWGRPSLARVRQLLAPMLAVPHAALAVGLVFLLAPSGLLARLVAPMMDWTRPSDGWVVPDAMGLSLILGLALKELPFLLFTALAYLPRLQPDEHLRQGRVLGYSAAQCWTRLILPQLLPMMRLPIAVVVAYNLTVVDMAIILGPGQPPTLALWVIEYFTQPGGRAQASIAALWLLAVVILSFALLHTFYRALAPVMAAHRVNGRRHRALPGWIARRLLSGLWLVSGLALISLLVWSFTQRWRFPDVLPSSYSLRLWSQRADDWWPLLENTLVFALASSVLAVLAAITWLELERHRQVPRLDAVWYVPLLLPQVCVLLGWQGAALLGDLDGLRSTLIWAHWVYAMPYALLMLAGPWRELNPGYERQAQLVGAGYLRRLMRIRLPLLIRAVLGAWALAMSVSIAQYLPTLLLGGGRFPTLTTELVTSFGGVDRRVIGVLASLQMALPWLAFALALALPAWLYRNRKFA